MRHASITSSVFAVSKLTPIVASTEAKHESVESETGDKSDSDKADSV